MGNQKKQAAENAGSATDVGKIGFGLSLVPWLILPLLLVLPKAAQGEPQTTGDTLRTISFCFYCFSPIALLASIAGIGAAPEKKYAVAGAVISGLFYAGLIVLYAVGSSLPENLRGIRP